MTNELRPVNRDDAAALAVLHRQCFEPAWSEDSFLSLLEGGGVFGFIATSSGAGTFESFAVARAAADEGEILTLGTLPAARRKGLATLLLGALIHEATRKGVCRLFLEVDEKNQSALGLYTGLGFHQAGRRAAYYESTSGPAAGALILCRNLPAAS